MTEGRDVYNVPPGAFLIKMRCDGQQEMRRGNVCTGGSPQVAMNGDVVHVHYICRDEEGSIVDDSADSEEPVCFEVSLSVTFGRLRVGKARYMPCRN